MSAPFAFQYEVTAEGLKKQAATRNIPKAQRYCLERWLTGVVFDARRSAGAMQKSGRKSGEMGRNVGMEIRGNEGAYQGYVGTGIGKTKSVPYASIQDKGGIVTARGKWLTIPFPGVKGTASQYDCFPLRTKRGNVILFEAKHNKRSTTLKPLFLLRKQVRIPASAWFTNVIIANYSTLDELMDPSEVYRVAEAMGSK